MPKAVQEMIADMADGTADLLLHNLRVLTLNCWGLLAPFSKWRKERMSEIADFLSKDNYDIVLLQEIWVEKDYDLLCSKLLQKMPYTHYFYSGVMGSGLCIFSKYSILETFQHAYTLSGFPHKVLHGDWFAGKAVGLAQINFNGFLIHVYITHTHADYGDPPRYRTLRIAQAHELAEFIKLTSQGCDAVVIGGDFNFKSSDLGFKIVLSTATLQDAWLTNMPHNKTEEDGWTSSVKDSPFADAPGSRIDYLLFRSNRGCKMICDFCQTTMKQVPNQPYFYSDHAAVEASFMLTRAPQESGPVEDLATSTALLKEALPHLHEGRKLTSSDQRFYGIAVIMCLLAVGLLPAGDGIVPVFFTVIRLIITLTLGFVAWMCLVACSKEINAYTATIKDINAIIRTKSSALKTSH